jgi:hypothetical protein
MLEELKSRATFVFTGWASEYSLGPLHRRMSDAGFACVEIDENKVDAVEALKRARTTSEFRVLLTSQRLNWGPGARRTRQLALPLLAALEAHALLQPHFSVSVPHDLTDQLYPHEAPMLGAFDLYLAATEEAMCLSPYVPVENVGWLKFDASDDVEPQVKPHNRAIWLVNYAGTLEAKLGTEGAADALARVADGLCSLKFAVERHRSPLEAALRERGQHIYPAATPFIQFTRSSDWIIGNAVSSVIRECEALGRKIYMIRDETITMPEQIAALPSIAHERNWRRVRSVREALACEPDGANTIGITRPDPPQLAQQAVLRYLQPVFERYRSLAANVS